MRKIRIKNKCVVTALLLALLLPLGALAQGGLFQRGDEPLRSSGAATLINQGFGNPMNGSDVTNQTFGNPTEGVNVTNQTFGAPLGSGLFILLLASAGYAATNKRTNKSKKENIK